MLTMQYHIDREFVDELYPAYPDDEAVKEQLVKSRLRSIVPEVLGRTTATEQYKGALSENSETIREELQRQLDPFGVRVDYFALKRSVFDESFETAIRARAGETEAAEKKKLEQTTAHNEAERQRIQAEGDANARRIAADVAAYETVKKAESDSQAETLRLEARAIQLTKHPELLEFERIQTIRDAGAIYLPDNALPIYQVPQQEKP
jgi:regulator of protease activity HflC (stomatin/prohibitin superfamily)